MESALALELVPLVFDGPSHEGLGRKYEGGVGGREEKSAEAESFLVERLRQGDADAFDLLVIAHLEALVGFATSFVGSIDTAEDVVQDALTRVWDRRETLPREISIRAYLFSTVRNRALDTLKYERVRTRAQTRIESEIHAAVGGDADDQELPAQQLAAVRFALTALPERQRTAIALRYGRGLKVTEIAAVLDVSPKAATQVLVRAIRSLRKAVGRE